MTYVLVLLPMSVASAGLLTARRPWLTPSGLLLVTTCVGYLIVHRERSNSPVVLLLWASVIVVATDRRPNERALLLRVCVSCVYGFTAFAKTNPSFLAGDQMVNLAVTREQMSWSFDLVIGPFGVLLAVATVLTEYVLAVGLWFARTRMAVAAVGVTLHTLLIPAAATSWGRGGIFLAVLNYGLVAMYPAFWYPISSRPATCSLGSEVDSSNRGHPNGAADSPAPSVRRRVAQRA